MSIQLTDRAAAHLRKCVIKGSKSFRLLLGRCRVGFDIVVDYDDPEPSDHVFQSGDIALHVSPRILEAAEGLQIDVEKDELVYMQRGERVLCFDERMMLEHDSSPDTKSAHGQILFWSIALCGACGVALFMATHEYGILVAGMAWPIIVFGMAMIDRAWRWSRCQSAVDDQESSSIVVLNFQEDMPSQCVHCDSNEHLAKVEVPIVMQLDGMSDAEVGLFPLYLCKECLRTHRIKRISSMVGVLIPLILLPVVRGYTNFFVYAILLLGITTACFTLIQLFHPAFAYLIGEQVCLIGVRKPKLR
ncbi:MAG: hypothetical protein KDA88_01025 [Planctomycetaceae bacterium]|nr:hypothetical protein [Planctomycetaceae bacterium]MCB9952444.1 hypothetical protein [Planctomycetaceae bacterium]